jgi:biopolymer transport protein ExbD
MKNRVRALSLSLVLVACHREQPSIEHDEPRPKKVASSSSSSPLESSALALDLPKAPTAGEVQLVLSVTIDASGKLAVDGVPVKDDAAVESAARKAITRQADVRAVIGADKSVPYGRVVAVLDLLKKSGVAKISLGLDTGTAPSPPIGP